MALLQYPKALLLAAALLCLPSACSAGSADTEEPSSDLPELGLMGTVPIYWGESADVSQLLAGSHEQHWARALLEDRYRLLPIDALDAASLEGIDYLLLAQPRGLSGSENVALDNWVREGGQLLLFADPMMTGESQFAIGDRRRPQDVILLSPILNHWGLGLQFDDEQPAGATRVAGAGVPLPVNLPGSFVLGEGEGNCRLVAGDVLARCRIGEGSALVLADAALLDLYDSDPSANAALGWLVDQAFEERGN